MICLRVGGLGVSLPSASHVLGLCAGANPLAKQSSAPSPTELHGDAYLRYQHGGELRDRHPGSVVVPLRSQLSNLRPLSPPDSPHSTVSSQVRSPFGGDMQKSSSSLISRAPAFLRRIRMGASIHWFLHGGGGTVCADCGPRELRRTHAGSCWSWCVGRSACRSLQRRP